MSGIILFKGRGGGGVDLRIPNIDADRVWLFLELVASARSSSWAIYGPNVDFVFCSDLTFY